MQLKNFLMIDGNVLLPKTLGGEISLLSVLISFPILSFPPSYECDVMVRKKDAPCRSKWTLSMSRGMGPLSSSSSLESKSDNMPRHWQLPASMAPLQDTGGTSRLHYHVVRPPDQSSKDLNGRPNARLIHQGQTVAEVNMDKRLCEPLRVSVWIIVIDVAGHCNCLPCLSVSGRSCKHLSHHIIVNCRSTIPYKLSCNFFYYNAILYYIFCCNPLQFLESYFVSLTPQ